MHLITREYVNRGALNLASSPAFQCRMLKNGRAWFAKSRAIRHRTVKTMNGGGINRQHQHRLLENGPEWRWSAIWTRPTLKIWVEPRDIQPILFVHDSLLSLAYPMITCNHPVAGNLAGFKATKHSVARRLQTNQLTHTLRQLTVELHPCSDALVEPTCLTHLFQIIGIPTDRTRAPVATLVIPVHLDGPSKEALTCLAANDTIVTSKDSVLRSNVVTNHTPWSGQGRLVRLGQWGRGRGGGPRHGCRVPL